MKSNSRLTLLFALSLMLGLVLVPGRAAARPLEAILATFEATATDSVFEDAVEIRWTGAAGYDVFFRIWRNGGLLTIKAANDSVHRDPTAVPGTVYDYCVSLHPVGGGDPLAYDCDPGSRILFRPTQVTASDGYYENWTQVEWLDNSQVETGYRVLRRVAGGGAYTLMTTVGPDETLYQDDTAVAGTLYDYCIQVEDADGHVSLPGCDSGSRGHVAPPGSVAASDGQYPSRVEVSWVDRSNREAGYRVYRDDLLIGNLPSNATSFTDAGALGAPHAYCVRSIRYVAPDTVESTPGCDVGVGGTSTLDPPMNVQATDASFDDRVKVTWNDAGSTEDGYAIYRDGLLVGNVLADINTFDDLAGQPGVSYSYCVAATNDSGGVSLPVCDEGTRSVVLAATNVSATDGSFEDQVEITWESTSTTTVLFRIYRDGVPIQTVSGADRSRIDSDVDAGTPHTYCVEAVTAAEQVAAQVCDTGFRRIVAPTNVKASDDTFEDRVVLTWNDGSNVEEGYRIMRRPAGGDYVALGDVGINETSYTDATAASGVDYEYSVNAFDLLGESLAGTDTGRRTLLAPTGFTASDGTSEFFVTLRWTDNSKAEDGYRIVANGEFLVDLGDNVTSHTVPVGPGNHLFQVRAFDAHGESSPAEDAGFAAIQAPREVTASDTYPDRVVVSWIDASQGETHYAIYRNSVLWATVPAGVTTWTDLAPLPGTATYCVQTEGPLGQSALVCDQGGTAPVVPEETASLFLTDNLGGGDALPGDGYGESVAMKGDLAVVGSPLANGQNGRVVLFERNAASGQWSEAARFDSPLPVAWFGSSVATDGQRVVVGARVGGTAYVIQVVNGAWQMTQLAIPFSPGIMATTEYGWDVAIDSGWILVSAPGFDAANNIPRPRIYAYERSGTSWPLRTSIEPEDGPATSRFGHSLDMEGTLLVVGSPEDSRVHVIRRLTALNWGRIQVLTAPADVPISYFGVAVDLQGDRVAVGAGFYAFLYRQQGGAGFQLEQTFSQTSNPSGFGETVALSTNYLLCGDRFANNSAGRVSAYAWTGAEWKLAAYLEPQGRPAGGQMGRAIAVSGLTILAGAPGNPPGSRTYLADLVAVPRNVEASDGLYDNRIAVRWSAQPGNEDEFRIYRDGVLVGTAPGGTNAWDDMDAAAGRSYEYCVTASSETWGETVPACDFGRREPNGAITGRVATLAGAGVPGVEVCLDPALNRAVRFDGAGTGIVVPEGQIGNSFTASFWLKTSASAEGQAQPVSYQTLLSYAVNLGNPAVLIGYSWETSRILLWANNQAHEVSIDGQPHGPALRNEWAHLAVRWRNADGRFDVLVNGVHVSATNSPTAGYVMPAAGVLRLGSDPAFQNNDFISPYGGLMDEVSLWSEFAPNEVIVDRMNRKIAPDESNLLGYWSFDAGEGTLADDAGPEQRYAVLSPGAIWSEESAPLPMCAVTDLEGNYVLSDLRYGTGRTLRVEPSFPGHQFEPGFKTITLAPGSPVQNEVEFRDVTTFTLSGNVRFNGTNCFVGNVEIQVDGETRALTDQNGDYDVSVNPGNHVISVRLGDHTFQPANVQVDATADAGNLDFLDTTLRTLSGRVGGGCNLPIGTVRLRIYPENGCVEPLFVDTDATYTTPLLPQKYFVQVEDVIGAPDVLDRADVLAFFREAGVRRIDLTSGSETLDFIYRAPLRIGVEGLPDPPVCSTFEDPERGLSMPSVPVIPQTERFPLRITVYEDYGNGNLCPLDSGTVTVFDEIMDEEDNPVILTVRNGIAVDEDGKPYVTAGNEPNIFIGRRDAQGVDRSYQKAISLVAEVEGRSPTTRTDWAMVTGYKARSATFTSVTEEIPLMILRDPPGDASSAFIEEGESHCTTISNAFFEAAGIGLDVEAFFGINIFKGQFVLTKTKAQQGLTLKMSLTAEGTEERAMTVCATATERIATSDSDQFIGAPGDLYMGVAMNLIFAKTDQISLEGCNITKSQGVAVDGDGFESSYIFSESHITGSLIPQLEELAALTTNAVDRVVYENAAENWRQQVALNDSLKQEAQFKVNRSFSAGASYEYTEESTKTKSFEWSVKASTTNELALGAQWETDVAEGKALFTTLLKFEYTRTQNEENSSTRTTGYTLSDDDIFDYFSVDVLEDEQYGTPVFRTVSGRGSCPWEFGTQPRDSAIVTIEPPVQLDVDPEGLAEFVLTLTNASPADETREYFLMPVQTSNSGGASIFAGGDTFIQLPYYIDAGQSQSVVLTVARGPVKYLYEDLQLVLIPVCEFDYWRNTGYAQLADTVTFTVQFRAPCSDITLFEPLPGWNFNATQAAATSNKLRLTLDDFELRLSETDSLEAVGAEYRPVNTEFWLPIQEIQRKDLPLTPDGDPKSVEILWDVASVPDGGYELRGYTRCESGRAFSNPATGLIDRVAPVPFGNPQPADSILAFGENISITFDEQVQCFTTPGDRIELVALNDESGTEEPVPFDTSCNGRTFIIAPSGADLAGLEGQTLVARVNGVKDLAGNDMVARNGGATEEWRFVVRQSAFTWAQIRILHEAAYRSPGSFFAELVNGRGDDVPFQILDVPAWLTAVPAAGNLAAGQAGDIQFVIQDDLALGVHEARVRAVIPGPGGVPIAVSPLDIRLEIVCRPPTFPFDPAGFQYSMNVTAQVSLGGQVQTDPNDVLAAYVGNQLRGVAHPEFDAGLNATRVYMTLYGNRTSGETVRFRYWDDSACRLYGASNASVPFAVDGQVGFPSPLVIVPADAPADSIQTIDVNEGWTWISLNLISNIDMSVNGILADLNPAAGDLIKGSATFSQFGEDTGWIGSLETLDNISGYKLKVSEAGTLFHTGQPFPVTTPIPVVTGWNLVSYLPQVPLAVSSALVNLKPAAGDVIKGQTGYSQYLKQGSIEGWFGSLDVLRPGEAYMLYLANASISQNSLRYPNVVAGPEGGVLSGASAGAGTVWAAGAVTVGPGWTLNPAAWQHSMTVTAEVLVDGLPIPEGSLVGAFSGGELRGVAGLTHNGTLDRTLAFLMVHSNVAAGEKLTFQVYDPKEDRLLPVDEDLAFTADMVRGTLTEPVTLHATGTGGPGTGGLPRVFALAQNYPNPPRGTTTIAYALPVDEHVKIQVFDVAGRLVSTLLDKRQPAGYASIQLDTSRYQSGMYFYRMEAGSFVRASRFVIAR